MNDCSGVCEISHYFYLEWKSSGWKKLAEGTVDLHECHLNYSYMIALKTKQLVSQLQSVAEATGRKAHGALDERSIEHAG